MQIGCLASSVSDSQVCEKDVSKAACEKIALQLGKSVGGCGSYNGFAYNYSTKGCYGYDDGEYEGCMYYGLVDNAELSAESQLGELQKPQQFRPQLTCKTYPSFVNVVKNGSTYTKNVGGSASYNAYAIWPASNICVMAGQTNKYVRVELTYDESSNLCSVLNDDEACIGFFTNNRLFYGGGHNGSYTTTDMICLRHAASAITLYKNDIEVKNWAVAARSGQTYAKIFFYDVGGQMIVSESVAPTPSPDLVSSSFLVFDGRILTAIFAALFCMSIQ